MKVTFTQPKDRQEDINKKLQFELQTKFINMPEAGYINIYSNKINSS